MTVIFRCLRGTESQYTNILQRKLNILISILLYIFYMCKFNVLYNSYFDGSITWKDFLFVKNTFSWSLLLYFFSAIMKFFLVLLIFTLLSCLYFSVDVLVVWSKGVLFIRPLLMTLNVEIAEH